MPEGAAVRSWTPRLSANMCVLFVALFLAGPWEAAAQCEAVLLPAVAAIQDGQPSGASAVGSTAQQAESELDKELALLRSVMEQEVQTPTGD